MSTKTIANVKRPRSDEVQNGGLRSDCVEWRLNKSFDIDEHKDNRKC